MNEEETSMSLNLKIHEDTKQEKSPYLRELKKEYL